MKVLITTVPFGDKNSLPLELLQQCNLDFLINPLGKKLTEDELAEMITDFDVLIAGTEPITEKVMSNAPKLKMISRVGIGLDGVDLQAAQRRGIKVSYTPDAPAPAVAELTIGLMISLLRSVQIANSQLHSGQWHRYFGKRIAECTVGVIGVGRIGTRVINRLAAFGTPRILVNDAVSNKELGRKFKVDWVDKETIYRESDIITLHLPLSKSTQNMIGRKELLMMKPDAAIINTSRGGIINEDALYDVMSDGHLNGAAIDVFVNEPYSGDLAQIERCILTAHMGSMSVDCRTRMEIEATEEVARFVRGEELISEVPEAEFLVQLQGL
ncbi:phosphoglycerate dehydrogenase [Planktomarina temperata]|nr:phosphoglycerate dehydrogenase [Planktomarina temperata]